MLWTMNAVVAALLTVVIELFLGVFMTATVLPLIFKACPYRFPFRLARPLRFIVQSPVIMYKLLENLG
jgi:hypothetical protein